MATSLSHYPRQLIELLGAEATSFCEKGELNGINQLISNEYYGLRDKVMDTKSVYLSSFDYALFFHLRKLDKGQLIRVSLTDYL